MAVRRPAMCKSISNSLSTPKEVVSNEWMHISTHRGLAQQAGMNGTIHCLFLNLWPCFAFSGHGWPIWKWGDQALPVGRYLQPHLALFCHIVNPPFPCYICFLFIKFPVWILTSAFLMSTTAFITDNNFLLQKDCIILHAFQITFLWTNTEIQYLALCTIEYIYSNLNLNCESQEPSWRLFPS